MSHQDDLQKPGAEPEEEYKRVFAQEEFWENAPLDDMDDLSGEKVYPHSVFKPAVKQPNFVLCVLVNVVRILAVLVLVAGLAVVGAVAGIAKGYMETAPTLDLAALDEIDWRLMWARYWADTDEDPDRKRRRQAEFLVHERFPVGLIVGIGVMNLQIKEEAETLIKRLGLKIPVAVKADWYY